MEAGGGRTQREKERRQGEDVRLWPHQSLPDLPAVARAARHGSSLLFTRRPRPPQIDQSRNWRLCGETNVNRLTNGLRLRFCCVLRILGFNTELVKEKLEGVRVLPGALFPR